MPMTRKDYIVISKILNNYVEENSTVGLEFEKLVFDFVDMFQEDNPRFNREKFLEAVYA